jgi:hypothetical protein
MGNINKVFALFLVLVLVVTGLTMMATMPFGRAQIGTTVSSQIINSDTTWTKTNSPYNITGPVEVAKGATITIQPGVTVNLNTFTMQVNGALTARGTSSNPITINGGYQPRSPAIGSTDRVGTIELAGGSSWNEQTGTGSIIE